MHIDFQDLKEQVDILNVVDMLNLSMGHKGDQLRGPCPRCNEGGERALVVTPEKGVGYCFAQKKGGDLLWLASHVLDIGIRDAALRIAEHFDIVPQDGGETVPPKSQAGEEMGTRTLQPLGYLHHELPAVQDLGITVEEAQAVGIGWAKKGMHRDRVAFPLRLPDGTLVGYIGYSPEDGTLKLPPKGLRI